MWENGNGTNVQPVPKSVRSRPAITPGLRIAVAPFSTSSVMHFPPPNGDLPPAGTPEKRGRKTTIICDDIAGTIRAVRVLSDLAFEWRIALDPVFWRFSQLKTDRDRARAADDMSDAFFVLVSLSRPERDLAIITPWLHSCLSARRPRCVTLLKHEAEGWTIAFRDERGLMTSRPELPAFFNPRRTVAMPARSAWYPRSHDRTSGL